jgi:voltage-gated sodium channel
MYGCDQYGYDDKPELCVAPYAMPVGAAFFFVIFVSIGTMIVLNLFVGVIMNSMDQANKEKELQEVAERRRSQNVTISDEIHVIHDKLEEIAKQLDLVSHRVERDAKS